MATDDTDGVLRDYDITIQKINKEIKKPSLAARVDPLRSALY